jgi:thiamine pyrophosphate-dependent acetolactate synthase large subunit-like protein
MPAREALAAIHASRGQRDIVVTTMTPARDWMTFPQHPLDVVMVPSAMGHATSIGLGLALAQPTRRVIVCNGDGSMLMNLGSLVSIVDAKAENLVVVVFENGVYEVTGSEPIPASGGVDFAAMARAAGFRSTFEFSDHTAWGAEVTDVLAANGPTFVVLRVSTQLGTPAPKSPGPAAERGRRFIESLKA